MPKAAADVKKSPKQVMKITTLPGTNVTPIGPALVRRDSKMLSEPSRELDTRLPHYRGANYLRRLLEPKLLKESVAECIRVLKPYVNDFDTIAFTGMSGALIGPPLALALGKDLIMVRKPSSSSHSSYLVEGDYAARSYIIADDFMASGATERRVYRAIKEAIPEAKYIGFLTGAPENYFEAVRLSNREGVNFY